jgi:RNA polymerase sigma-70 factor (ECF subfamily)
MAEEENDDIELMMRVRKKNDKRAFATLVGKYQDVLLNFFMRSGVEYDAEDLAQQTFLRLYRYRANYQATAKFTTFLFLMARQVWIDELRRRQRRQKLEEAMEAEPPETFFSTPPDSSALTGNKLDLQRALAALPESLRQIVELGVYQEMAYSDIAKVLGIPVGTVKSRMFNALARLRELMK